MSRSILPRYFQSVYENSVAGTGRNVAIAKLPMPPCTLFQANILNANASYAELGQIHLIRGWDINNTDAMEGRMQTLKSGECMNWANLEWVGNIPISEPSTIVGEVYHSASILHAVQALLEMPLK